MSTGIRIDKKNENEQNNIHSSTHLRQISKEKHERIFLLHVVLHVKGNQIDVDKWVYLRVTPNF